MIRALGLRLSRVFRVLTPDPFVLAIFLTVAVFALAWAVEGASPRAIVRAWQGDSGFWSLLAFSMQMVLILVTGHALAEAPSVRRALGWLATLPRTGAQAAWMVSSMAIATGLLNWGLGLIVGAVLAREVGQSCARRGVGAHYPLICASGYTALLCWHGGISGTAPLMMTTPANVTEFLGDLAVGTLPFTRTVFGPTNLVITGGLLVLVPLLCAALAPKQTDDVESMPLDRDDTEADDTAEPVAAATSDPDRESWLERIDRGVPFTLLVVVLLLAAIVMWVTERGLASLDPNALNLIVLTAGLMLHGSVRNYVRALTNAVQGGAGIVLQFPFYAGIMGVMRSTGLGATFADAVTGIASPSTFAPLTMVSAGIINLFVPSGGGQWAVQGPIAMEAASRLDVPYELAVMSVAYGDQLTNMLQPFWALPLLAITGVRARDIVGYTATLMVVAGVWCGAWLYVFSP